ncbi:MAG: alpha/beta fold hydrolase [Desulfomonile tiedjei]|nr:alpha/beta fold hydrolase [Desulfomonile tiedjei]
MELNLIRVFFGKLLDALRIKSRPGATAVSDALKDRRQDAFQAVCEGITIRGRTFFPVAKPSRQYPVVIICHGIPGSGAQRPPDDPGYDGLAEELASKGLVAVIFNFRGCGDSGGNFDMMGWARDLETVVDRVLNTPYIDPTRIVVLGFSGGGAAAIYAAADNPQIFGLAVVGTPADFKIFEADPDKIIADFRKRGIIRDPAFPPDVKNWVHGFEAIEPCRWIAHFKGKHLLIVHGDADELIPLEQAYELFERAPAGLAQVFVIPEGVHRLRLDQRCIDILEKWFSQILGW